MFFLKPENWQILRLKSHYIPCSWWLPSSALDKDFVKIQNYTNKFQTFKGSFFV